MSETIAAREPRNATGLREPGRKGPGRRGRAKTRWVPGEVGIWGFILTDMTGFGVYFLVVAYQRTQQPEVFAHGRQLTNLWAGVLNTFLLLTASFFVALAVHHVRQGRPAAGRGMLLGTGICGTGFVVNKYFEWGAELAAGHNPLSDNFFQLYYVLTGIHLLHVLVALAVGVYLWRMAGRVRNRPTARQLRFIENGASYWHMVDLIWLGLFALFYLTS
jgi:nitric oxide reductase NorE protein